MSSVMAAVFTKPWPRESYLDSTFWAFICSRVRPRFRASCTRATQSRSMAVNFATSALVESGPWPGTTLTEGGRLLVLLAVDAARDEAVQGDVLARPLLDAPDELRGDAVDAQAD